ncbi:hypothetical protein DBR42_28430 [Pelomonas sp. HMWF004]|nr:hypothetical protein DBR42_28430 [Pelomonas sp. HMWF004]
MARAGHQVTQCQRELTQSLGCFAGTGRIDCGLYTGDGGAALQPIGIPSCHLGLLGGGFAATSSL